MRLSNSKSATPNRKTPTRKSTADPNTKQGWQPGLKRRKNASPVVDEKEPKRQKTDEKSQKKQKTGLRRASTLKATLRNSHLTKFLRPQSRLVCA
jgi:hypothetical protein